MPSARSPETILAERGLSRVPVARKTRFAVSSLGPSIAVFEDGIIQQIAPPDDLYERPDNSFVAQFIGENNTITGTVDSINDDVAEVTLDLR